MRVKTLIAGHCVIGRPGERALPVGAARAGLTLNPSGIAGRLSGGSLALICAEQPRERGRFQFLERARSPARSLRRATRSQTGTDDYAQLPKKTEGRLGAGPRLLISGSKVRVL